MLEESSFIDSQLLTVRCWLLCSVWCHIVR